MSDPKQAAAHWLAQAEEEARLDQKAIDDLDSLNAPDQWGDINIARQRNELVAARDEHLREVAYWRAQLEAPTGAALDGSPTATRTPSQ